MATALRHWFSLPRVSGLLRAPVATQYCNSGFDMVGNGQVRFRRNAAESYGRRSLRQRLASEADTSAAKVAYTFCISSSREIVASSPSNATATAVHREALSCADIIASAGSCHGHGQILQLFRPDRPGCRSGRRQPQLHLAGRALDFVFFSGFVNRLRRSAQELIRDWG
jgi:hypothetical protein